MSMSILIFAFLFVFVTPAYAYIDPGVVSIIIQGLIAAIAAVTTYCTIYWSKVKSFFKRKEKKEYNENKKKD